MIEHQKQTQAHLKDQVGRKEAEEVQPAGGVKDMGEQAGAA